MAKMMIEVYQCEICKGAILGSMVGFGDGYGDKFVHIHCWEAFQQGLHLTGGILPHSQTVSNPQPLVVSQADSTPPTRK
jgi:hypothetical protein